MGIEYEQRFFKDNAWTESWAKTSNILLYYFDFLPMFNGKIYARVMLGPHSIETVDDETSSSIWHGIDVC